MTIPFDSLRLPVHRGVGLICFRSFVRFWPDSSRRHEVHSRLPHYFAAALHPNREPQQLANHCDLFRLAPERLDPIHRPPPAELLGTHPGFDFDYEASEVAGEPVQESPGAARLEEFFSLVSCSPNPLSVRAAW